MALPHPPLSSAMEKAQQRLHRKYVQAGLPSDNWILVSHSKDKEDELRSQPAFSTAPAVVEDRLYTTPPSTFRLDYFSANILLDSILEQFGK